MGLTDYLFFVFLNLLGAMSPGPDFAIVTRYGLTGSRRAALLATAGIITALFIHIFYCLVGIAVILHSSDLLFSSLQIAGALYLAYLGIRLLLPGKPDVAGPAAPPSHTPFLQGFLTNLLNPKASMYLLSLFAEFITPETTTPSKIVYGLLVPATALGWFSFLSYMLTHEKFLPHLQRYQVYFMKAMGIMLLLLAVTVLASVLIRHVLS